MKSSHSMAALPMFVSSTIAPRRLFALIRFSRYVGLAFTAVMAAASHTFARVSEAFLGAAATI